MSALDRGHLFLGGAWVDASIYMPPTFVEVVWLYRQAGLPALEAMTNTSEDMVATGYEILWWQHLPPLPEGTS
jgi:hypothetical protein